MLGTNIKVIVINECNQETGELVGKLKTSSGNFPLVQNEDLGFQFIYNNSVVNLFDHITEDLHNVVIASYLRILFDEVTEIKIKTNIDL